MLYNQYFYLRIVNTLGKIESVYLKLVNHKSIVTVFKKIF